MFVGESVAHIAGGCCGVSTLRVRGQVTYAGLIVFVRSVYGEGVGGRGRPPPAAIVYRGPVLPLFVYC